MYTKLILKDATKSILNNNSEVTLSFKDETSEVIQFTIKTNFENANNIIELISKGYEIFINKDLNTMLNVEANLSIKELEFYKKVTLDIDDEDNKVDKQTEVKENQILSDENIDGFSKIFKELTNLEKYSESIELKNIQKYIKEVVKGNKRLIFLLSLIVLLYRINKEINPSYSIKEIKECIKNVDKLKDEFKKFLNIEDICNYINASFLFENLEEMKELNQSDFDEALILMKNVSSD
ncbi:hypothetical protein K4S71_09780 [Staphylococcus epidermidis]|nr:hypothetical protein [Staphylococcus epidermidis]MCG1591652.1 hypothetical protein [Staphylococcus epidermidis]MCG2478643.1 hypothetical protein [Staphylococcus epidermidis]